MTDDEPKLIHSPLERTVAESGVSVSIYIFRAETEPTWLLEIEDHLGGSTCWEDRFASDQDALDEATKTIQEDGIGSFAAASAAAS
jgi:hypothetical protein